MLCVWVCVYMCGAYEGTENTVDVECWYIYEANVLFSFRYRFVVVIILEQVLYCVT